MFLTILAYIIVFFFTPVVREFIIGIGIDISTKIPYSDNIYRVRATLQAFFSSFVAVFMGVLIFHLLKAPIGWGLVVILTASFGINNLKRLKGDIPMYLIGESLGIIIGSSLFIFNNMLSLEIITDKTPKKVIGAIVILILIYFLFKKNKP